ncbi:extracellular solute-binding protein [Patescibacteria group bacterium]|nr:extracellular solute-binding protein [Patescibacteria group bacterium]
MNYFKNKYFIGVFIILIAVIFTGQLCGKSEPYPDAVTLQFWGVFDEEEYFSESIEQFQTQFPYVTIEYTKFRPEEYEKELKDAWARGEGPDLYAVPNYKMGEFKQFSAPLPATMNLKTVTVKETLGKSDVSVETKALKGITDKQLYTLFPDVVGSDVIFSDQTEDEKTATNKIFGLPLSVDTLAMYYNKDLLNQAQIAIPATTWAEFLDQVKSISTIDKDGSIVRSGTSLGTANNIPRVFDIVSILMMQNGATMADGNSVRFDLDSETQDGYYPGIAAADFYTSFADPNRESYSWNENLPEALEYFSLGNIGFFFGYHYHLAEIKEANPNLNFDIAELPQVDMENIINYANYWNYSVSTNSANSDLAWYFIQNLTTNEENAKFYLDKTEQPAALKSLIPGQEDIFEVQVFNNQTLTSQSWYHGKEPNAADAFMKEMITAINDGTLTLEEAVETTASKIELTFQ